MSPLAKFAQLWHQRLTWPAALAMLLFVISGISHPIMVWTGPQQTAFFPPKQSFDSSQVEAMVNILQQNHIAEASLVKLVPAQDKVLLQITRDLQQPRDYYDLSSAVLLSDYDQQQAKWLASYYTGRSIDEIKTVAYKTDFDMAYPAVNRQLPVWRVDFIGEDNLTAYIHTETLTVAAINNDWKRGLQWLFQVLHTQHALQDIPWLQFTVMNLLMAVLMFFSVMGVILIFALPKRKKITHTSRRWHRRLALVIYVPLIMLLISGFYHLWFSYLDTNAREQRLLPPLSLTQLKGTSDSFKSAMDRYRDQPLDQVSLIANTQGELFARLSVPNGAAGKAITREQRFAGKGQEKQAVYIPLKSDSRLDDRGFVKQVAAYYLPANTEITAIEPITFFGPSYDFRNKRLPVWQIDTQAQRIFVDAKTGILVDQIKAAGQYERLSFQMLHKWNWLTPITGRFVRDMVMMMVLALVAVALCYGIALKLKRRRRIAG